VEDRFGIPVSEFKDGLLFTHRQSWWFLKKSPSTALPSRLKVRMAGLKAFQKVGVFIKPTTRLIQALGPRATKSRLDLSPEQLQSLLTQGAMDFPAPDLEDGYVILCLGEYVLGLGLLIGGKLKSQIPRKHLKYYGVDQ
jgi:NOL1/NOP2/fmu family ribosome biogenesis protein